MLTPSAKDPNRKAELERRKKEPSKFGAAHEDLINNQVKAKRKAAEK